MAEQKKQAASRKAAGEGAKTGPASPGEAATSVPPVESPEAVPTGSPPPDETPPEELKGDELEQKAREMDIEGRSKMDAEEKRAAVTEAARVQRAPASLEELHERAGADERAFPKTRLLESSSQLLGHPSHVVAGALYEEPDDAVIRVSDAMARIETFLNREVE